MRRGFSLFEIVLAIAIMLLLGGAVFGFFFELMDQRKRVEAASGMQQAAGVMLERLESDVQTVIAGSGAVGAGIRGTNDRLALLSRGVTAPLQDRIVALGDLQGSEWEFDEQTGELRARRWDALSDRGRGAMEVVSRDFERVRFRYHDGSGWKGTFDSSATGALPVAVEVAVWFRREEREELKAEAFGPVDEERGNGRAGEPRPRRDEVEAEEEPKEPVVREPDRLRVIIVPDGPVTGLLAGGAE